mmetsp:Transcript_39440/g.111839  ORF Transcript_39440/g.111839 Transcript_39440/m.111839 type:complete len:206 (+) Transcript_39440:170-787(+)
MWVSQLDGRTQVGLQGERGRVRGRRGGLATTAPRGPPSHRVVEVMGLRARGGGHREAVEAELVEQAELHVRRQADVLPGHRRRGVELPLRVVRRPSVGHTAWVASERGGLAAEGVPGGKWRTEPFQTWGQHWLPWRCLRVLRRVTAQIAKTMIKVCVGCLLRVHLSQNVLWRGHVRRPLPLLHRQRRRAVSLLRPRSALLSLRCR